MRYFERKDIKKLSYEKQVMFALFCLKQMILCDHITNKQLEMRKKCADVLEKWLKGEVSEKYCIEVAKDASNVYASVASNVVYSIFAEQSACRLISSAAHRAFLDRDYDEEVLKEQWHYYDQLFNFDKYFEEIVLDNSDNT